jgi:hypothetical protein
MKKILNFVLACVFAVLFTGVLTGCGDEIKTHHESEVTTEQQEMVVEP